MEPRIHGNRAQSRAPATEQDLEELGTVLEVENDARSGTSGPRAERSAEPGCAAGKLRVRQGGGVGGDRGALGKPSRDL